MNFSPKTALDAWNQLAFHKNDSYDSLSAMYSGEHSELKRTGEESTFWKRSNSQRRVHVPIVHDIARTSSDLLFSEEPRFTVFHEDTEQNESEQQKRLDEIIHGNRLNAKLAEAAETASAMGDVYLKVRWDEHECGMPIIDVVQPDCALPEYIGTRLVAVHFFTVIKHEFEKDKVYRLYERYDADSIVTEAYLGGVMTLGVRMPDAWLEELGFETEIKMPVHGIAATHIANMRPNRKHRNSMLGRADVDGLRDLCDALDETYSSWIRDIRLAKARLIIPVEYLKRKPSEMSNGVATKGSWEFDPDIETYVAMDINTDNGGAAITPSQFAIRSAEHSQTVSDLLREIITCAGYSPQSFGLDINGSAQSGTALTIREKKSANTRSKKQVYWQAPLETLMTFILKLDAVVFRGSGSDGKDTVKMTFYDAMGFDPSSIATTIATLVNAQAVSDETKVRMLHPDWSEQQVTAELDRLHEKIAEEVTAETPDIDAILAQE